MHEYMGDMMLVAGDGAAGPVHYETALKHRHQASMNAANKAQAERTHLFKSAIAALIRDEPEAAAGIAEEYNAAVAESGTQSEQRRMHELAAYIAMNKEDYATASGEFSQANQLDPIVLYWYAVTENELGNTEKARDLAYRAAYRNTLSGNLPFFRNDAIELYETLGGA